MGIVVCFVPDVTAYEAGHPHRFAGAGFGMVARVAARLEQTRTVLCWLRQTMPQYC